jgi:outer membrane protein assembly factor BamB
VNGAAAVAGDRTFVAGCDSLMHVIDAANGKPVGTVDLGGQAAATAAVAGDLVVVGTMTNQVVAVDWKKLKKAWEFEPKRRQQPFYASAAVTDSLVVTGSRDRKVYALDRATGQEKWSFVTEGMVDPSPVVAGGRVYVGCLSTTGEFYVLDLTSGTQVQQLTLDSAVTGSVAVGPDCVIVGTEKGTVYCLGAKK